MQANITVLPWRESTEAQAFMDSLHRARAEALGEELVSDKLDEAGLMALKAQLASESKAIAVK